MVARLLYLSTACDILSYVLEVILIKDRFTRGFLSGAIAGIPIVISSAIAYNLQWTTLRWAHFAAVLIYGRKYETLWENLFASLATLFFTGLLGIIFAYLIPKMTSRNYLLKGWVFSVAIWFLCYAVTLLFQVPELQNIPLKTAFFNFILATIWGLALGYALHWFDDGLKT